MLLFVLLFVLLFLVTPRLVVAVQPCMEGIPIKKKMFVKNSQAYLCLLFDLMTILDYLPVDIPSYMKFIHLYQSSYKTKFLFLNFKNYFQPKNFLLGHSTPNGEKFLRLGHDTS